MTHHTFIYTVLTLSPNLQVTFSQKLSYTKQQVHYIITLDAMYSKHFCTSSMMNRGLSEMGHSEVKAFRPLNVLSSF